MLNEYFKSERLLYRPYQADDIQKLVERANEKSWRQWFYFQEPDCLTEQFWIDEINKNISTWNKQIDILNDDSGLGVVLKETGRLIGNIGIYKRCRPEVNLDGLEIGYGIFEAYQGNGYATEAAKAAFEWALGRFGEIDTYPKIEAHIEHENLPSRRVAEKAGFIFDRAEKYVTVYSFDSTLFRA